MLDQTCCEVLIQHGVDIFLARYPMMGWYDAARSDLERGVEFPCLLGQHWVDTGGRRELTGSLPSGVDVLSQKASESEKKKLSCRRREVLRDRSRSTRIFPLPGVSICKQAPCHKRAVCLAKKAILYAQKHRSITDVPCTSKYSSIGFRRKVCTLNQWARLCLALSPLFSAGEGVTY